MLGHTILPGQIACKSRMRASLSALGMANFFSHAHTTTSEMRITPIGLKMGSELLQPKLIVSYIAVSDFLEHCDFFVKDAIKFLSKTFLIIFSKHRTWGLYVRGVLELEFSGVWRGILCTVSVVYDKRGEVRNEFLVTDLPFITEV